MPKASSLKPVKPRTIARLSLIQTANLNEALANARNGHHSKAGRLFEALASEMELYASDVAIDSASMKANAVIMLAEMELDRNRDKSENHFIEAAKFLDQALEPDQFWADYLLLKGRITSFLHSEFGCKISRLNGIWEIHCIDVSNALHIPGISRSEKFDLECSICGKDPMFCRTFPDKSTTDD